MRLQQGLLLLLVSACLLGQSSGFRATSYRSRMGGMTRQFRRRSLTDEDDKLEQTETEAGEEGQLSKSRSANFEDLDTDETKENENVTEAPKKIETEPEKSAATDSPNDTETKKVPDDHDKSVVKPGKIKENDSDLKASDDEKQDATTKIPEAAKIAIDNLAKAVVESSNNHHDKLNEKKQMLWLALALVICLCAWLLFSKGKQRKDRLDVSYEELADQDMTRSLMMQSDEDDLYSKQD